MNAVILIIIAVVVILFFLLGVSVQSKRKTLQTIRSNYGNANQHTLILIRSDYILLSTKANIFRNCRSKLLQTLTLRTFLLLSTELQVVSGSNICMTSSAARPLI